MKTELSPVDLVLKDHALDVAAEGITIADARLPDMPLIYVNRGFEMITGYEKSEVLGSNCRFLQGPETDPETAAEIRASIAKRRECLVEILNYRKDGSKFWNRLSITPIRDQEGRVTHFIGVQSDVTVRRRAEEQLAQANQRMRRSLEAAARIQHSLLPNQLPDLDGMRVAWSFRPCNELAGDTLNVIRLDERHLGIYIIDVSGHGVPAALLSVTLTHTLSGNARDSCLFIPAVEPGQNETINDPVLVARRLNEQFQMDPVERVQYFTMLYAILNLESLQLQFVCAGHPPALVVPAQGDCYELSAEGHPIGLLEDAKFESRSARLEGGDRVFFYTDGVTEARSDSDEQLGSKRLIEMLMETRTLPLQNSVERVIQGVESWCGEDEPEDDVSILAFELSG